MAKKLSKKKKEEKRAKAHAFNKAQEEEKISQTERSLRSKFRLPKNVDIPTAGSDLFKKIAEKSYVLSFNFYNFDCCELYKISNGNSGGLIRAFDRMSKTTPNKKQQIVRETIHRKQGKSGDYEKLFHGLPPDEESLNEMQFSGQGRIFFFTTENQEKNFINVVSIKPVHLNADD